MNQIELNQSYRNSFSKLNSLDSVDQCPIRHTYIKPITLVGTNVNSFDKIGSDTKQIVFQCTRQECNYLFIGTFIKWQILDEYHRLTSLEPVIYKKPIFSPKIQNLSPNFYAVYTEAAHALIIGLKTLPDQDLGNLWNFI